MNAKSIVRAGDPVLRRVAAPVADPRAPEIAELIREMEASLAEAGGIGLAAPQIGVSERVILVSVPATRKTDDPEDGPLPLTALINPALTPVGDDMALGMEGCLSIPGLRGEVPRWLRVRLTATTPEGEPVDTVMTGMRARVLQHEVDHLNGILYLDRMTDFTHFGYVEELIEADMRDRPSPSPQPDATEEPVT
ncbi:peptide deformylase [Thalassobaculum sp. OXR-137]|uniref:peptide deformylase n=1 Tax=Thalassobaculum sp. OXR-137 TaxID=3100173 RepID=UPI002AC8DA06|nr:peptide deformylase [Thalassobaculum sp. OXR-137]WPZ36007.1 peptide deformylase [Thalassobaculum sp. OXR-137]